MNTNNQFFFYGTLMSTECRGDMVGELAELVGPAQIRGDLYACSAFPMLVAGDGIVKGELWRARTPKHVPSLLRRLDRIEGYDEMRPEGSMYLREVRELITPQTLVSTYVWNRPIDSSYLELVADGDWRRYAADNASLAR